MLANRLRKNIKQLRKWVAKNDISCYRIYEKDIPEYPLIIDLYEDIAVIWALRRKKDETEAMHRQYLDQCKGEIQEALGLKVSELIFKERKRQKGESQYEKVDSQQIQMIVREQGLQFEVNLYDYLDTGLFLDHRNTRKKVQSESENKKVLNLFAYTGAFSCYAFKGGASSVVTVDMSKTYCDWARRNLKLNGSEDEKAFEVKQRDCLEYLKSEIHDDGPFDIIVCDPPTFSNSKRMQEKVFSVSESYPWLIERCVIHLNEGGKLYFSCNDKTFVLDESKLKHLNIQIRNISSQSVPLDFRNKKIHQCWEIVKNED